MKIALMAAALAAITIPSASFEVPDYGSAAFTPATAVVQLGPTCRESLKAAMKGDPGYIPRLIYDNPMTQEEANRLSEVCLIYNAGAAAALELKTPNGIVDALGRM